MTTQAPAVLSPEHRAYLTQNAITDDVIEAQGIRTELNAAGQPEIVFTWRDGVRTTTQRRPWPGEAGAYFWEKDRPLHFNVLRDPSPQAPVLLVEGTKQSLAVASWAHPRYAVYGMAGAWGWAKCSLEAFADRDVFVVLDGDAADSLDVYDAGDRLADALELEDATPRFVRLPVQGKEGADDYLASLPQERRTDRLDRLVGKAETKPAKRKPTTRSRKPAPTALPDVGDRVPVAVNLDRQQVIGQILGAMKDRWDAEYLYDFGGALTALKGPKTVPLDKGSFLKLLTDAVAAFHYTAPADNRPAKFDPGWPDGQTVDAVLSSASEFSTLNRVVRVPFIRPDGTLCDKPGYDPVTGTVLVLDAGMDRLSVPLEPTRADTDAAVALLLEEWLGDFAFHRRADRANVLALVLTPFIRGSVALVPLCVVSGLQMGVGKNLLADCFAIVTTGKAVVPLPYVQDEDETRKQITATFRSGTDLFIFDEAHEIEGKQFARALTSITYTDRILGVSTMVEFPNNVTWVSLGNQVKVNSDMSRRVYFVNLRPADANPQDREGSAFRHPELREWTVANRPELAGAALTLIRAWYAAGCPQYSRGSSMGSFETWDRMVSGILGHAGVHGFLEDAKAQRSESDFTGALWTAHVAWLRQVFGDREFTTGDVRAAALRHSDTWEAPPGMESVAEQGYTRKLGQQYARCQDRWFDGLKLVKLGTGHNNTIKWSVHLQGGTGTDPGTGGGTGTDPADGPNAGEGTVNGTDPDTSPRVPTSDTSEGPTGVSTTIPASSPKPGEADISRETRTEKGPRGVTGVTPKLRAYRETTRLALPVSIPERVFAPIWESWGLTPVTPLPDSGADPFEAPAPVPYPDPVAVEEPVEAPPQPVPAPVAVPVDRLPAVRPVEGLPNPFAVPDTLPAPAPGAELVLDLETGSADDMLTADPGSGYVRLVCLGDGDGNTGVTVDVERGLDVLRSSDGRILTVNGALFDLPALDRHHGIPVEETIPRVHDMRLVAFQADPPTSRETKQGPSHKSYSMDSLLERYAGQRKSDLGKALAKQYGGWDRIPGDDPRFLEYGRSDVRDTLTLARYLPMTPYDEREAQVAAITARATLSGFRTDVDGLRRRSAELAALRETGVRLLADRFGFPLTKADGKPSKAPQKTKGGAEAFRVALESSGFPGVANWPRNKDGSLSLGKGVMAAELEYAQELGNDLAVTVIQAIQGLNGLRSSADNMLRCVTADGRVHPLFEPFQSTGRWSVTEPGLTVAMKGTPDSERQYMLPEPGHVIVCFDADQVDIRGVAAHSQDPNLLEIMCDPTRDIHNEVSDGAYGDHREEHRKPAKTMDLGWLYGRTVNGLAMTPGITREGAERLDTFMSSSFRGVMQWQDKVRAWTKAGNLLDNGFGRRLRCTPGSEYTQAPAMMGQSTTRDVVAQGLLVMRRKYPHLVPLLRVIVHDEIVMSLPVAYLEEYCAQVIDAMTFTFMGVPMTWGQSRPGENWNQCYLK
jgi:DNA polymerase I-like protein with 3'-5' exonuclease and polymerase domains